MLMRSHRMACLSFVLMLACVYPESVFAASTGSLPWNSPMQTIVNFFTGPFVRYALAAIIVLLGIGFAFDEDRMHKWLGRGTRAVVGGVIAATVLSWGLPFIGVGSGALLP